MLEYILIPRNTLEWIAKIDLSRNQYRVLCYLMSRLDYTEWKPLSSSRIANQLGLPQSTVQRILNELKECGLISTGKRISGTPTFQLTHT